MKSLRQVFFFIFLAGVSMPAFAQTATVKNKMEMNANSKMDEQAMKKHVCTDACKKGSHVYLHGEKGHKCTDACRKTNVVSMDLKEHVCTKDCEKAGKHVYVHGEKGHVCTAACEKETQNKM
jgi:hypothetical protein